MERVIGSRSWMGGLGRAVPDCVKPDWTDLTALDEFIEMFALTTETGR